MTAGDWVGWLAVTLVVLAVAAVTVGRVAADWALITRWYRARMFAVTHADALVALTHAEAQARVDIARLRSERDTLRRENTRLERELDRFRQRERSAVTVLQLPRI